MWTKATYFRFDKANLTTCILLSVVLLPNLFHFSTSFKVTLISLSIIFFKNTKGMWSYVSIVGRKTYISMLSLYSIWDYYFSLFLHWKCVAPLHSTQLFLYTICLEDISKGIWIVKIGMYFFRFLQSVSITPLLFTLQWNTKRRRDFRNIPYKLKIFYRFELLDVPLLTF